VLLNVAIKAADQDSAALAIEPGLNAITHMGRSVDFGILIVQDTDVTSLGNLNEVSAASQGLCLESESEPLNMSAR